MEQPPCLHLL
ncbi:unnamed protein product, partial [Allacma fusca]